MRRASAKQMKSGARCHQKNNQAPHKKGTSMEGSDESRASILDIRSLRQQVYEYLRGKIQAGSLVPGSFINLNEISQQLGISKTPLRDAIIQMECEGFVTILPRRGVLIKRLSLEEIRNILEIVGALESTVVRSVSDRLMPDHLDRMQQLNKDMRVCIQQNPSGTFDTQYYQLNLAFHNVFLDLSTNMDLKQMLMIMKQRLYDFPRLNYIKEWEWINCDEHDRFIQFLREGQKDDAARLWRINHWGFECHEKYIREFYAQGEQKIQHDLELLK
jgi:DNA-binding GntR family transcriptional regulator